MQLAAPEALDLSERARHILQLYGLDHGKSSFDKEINALEETDYFRPQLPRRPAAAGARRAVRAGLDAADNGFPRRNWDSHEDMQADHGPLAVGMARGAAALIRT